MLCDADTDTYLTEQVCGWKHHHDLGVAPGQRLLPERLILERGDDVRHPALVSQAGGGHQPLQIISAAYLRFYIFAIPLSISTRTRRSW
jgi:hypothetical protein